MATINNISFPLSGTIACPKCQQEVVLYDPAGSEYAVCTNCYSYLQLFRNEPNRTYKKLQAPVLQPLLKIGSKGVIKNEEFKVIAYLEKKELGTTYYWREYILYSYKKGYVTLAEFDGHWSIIVDQNFYPDFKTPFSYGDSVSFKDVPYRLFNKYTPIVTAMIGELDWDVVNEKVKTTEFIAPPFMIVKETINNSVLLTDYFIGEYIEINEIASAFNLNETLFPSKVGIGAIQPSKHYDRWKSSYQITTIAIILILMLQLVFNQIKPEKVLINDDFMISSVAGSTDNAFKSFVTPSFTLEDYSSNVEFEIASAVDNNWLETSIILVNEKSNRTWEVSKGIEYYHGYEDGESWSEGSTKESVILSGIPSGKYHLNVYPSSGDANRNNLYIKAVANVTMWRNIILTMLALLLYPAFCWYMMRNFEKKRWSNSDYSPFVNAD